MDIRITMVRSFHDLKHLSILFLTQIKKEYTANTPDPHFWATGTGSLQISLQLRAPIRALMVDGCPHQQKPTFYTSIISPFLGLT